MANKPRMIFKEKSVFYNNVMFGWVLFVF